jgi:hypothetical protein
MRIGPTRQAWEVENDVRGGLVRLVAVGVSHALAILSTRIAQDRPDLPPGLSCIGGEPEIMIIYAVILDTSPTGDPSWVGESFASTTINL